MSVGWNRRLLFGAFALIGGGIAVSRPESSPAAAQVSISVFPVVGACGYSDTYGAARSGGRSHEGVDIIAREGLPLVAVANGTISKIVLDHPGALGGNYLRLSRADGTYFTYIHLSRFADGLFVGQQVVAGQIIGFVGQTGAAAGPHLHFEVHPFGGPPVNPTAVVNGAGGCGGKTAPTGSPASGVARQFDPAVKVFTSTTSKPARVAFGVPILGVAGVSATAQSVDITITLTGSGPGRAAIWPCGTRAGLRRGTPLTATKTARATSSRVTIRPGDGGRVCVVAESRVGVVVLVHASS